MSIFYKQHAMMEALVTGDMAQEALAIEEEAYLQGRCQPTKAEWEQYCREEAERNRPDELCQSGIKRVNGKSYRTFDGDEVPGAWNKGDFYYDREGNFKQVPDWWHLEDLRQSEVIYRPL